jgi:AAA ATPase domain
MRNLLAVKKTLTAEIPLMSRDTEMDWILARLKRPEPVAFVLAGEPGVGKTRLASEAARSAAGLGFTTAQAVASRAAAAIPFGPFAPFLPEAGYSPGDLLGLLRRASDAILERAGPDHKLLLVVDDAQFLDEGSAALVHQLVQKGACSVLASLRTPGPAPEPVTALWKDGLAERIDLHTWGEVETEAVLSAVLGGPVAISSVRRMWEVSQGNALYLRELLIGAVDSGALTETGGIWALRKPLTAPGRLVELVASRLSGLAPGTVAVIELLAAGEPLGVPVLEKITDPAGLEDAEAQGLVQVSQDGRRTVARLAHPVYGEALRQSLPRSRLRRISAVLAGAIEAQRGDRRHAAAGPRGGAHLPGPAAGPGDRVPARRVPARSAADAGPGAGDGGPGQAGRRGQRTAADRGLAGRQPRGHRVRSRAERIADQHAAVTG